MDNANSNQGKAVGKNDEEEKEEIKFENLDENQQKDVLK